MLIEEPLRMLKKLEDNRKELEKRDKKINKLLAKIDKKINKLLKA